MSIFFLKSILSIAMLLMALAAMFTMFEMLGRRERRLPAQRLLMAHKINGALYILLFLFIAYFCVKYIIASKAELAARAVFHSLFALLIIVVLAVKIAFIEIYRQFYGKVQTLGLLIAITTFGLVGTSGAYLLLVTEFGREKTFEGMLEQRIKGAPPEITIRTDPESIGSGKTLFRANCDRCHDPYSTNTIVGPGLKGVLKNQRLPVSGRPATPENIRNQLKTPYRRMPSFAHLPDREVEYLTAFLNSL